MRMLQKHGRELIFTATEGQRTRIIWIELHCTGTVVWYVQRGKWYKQCCCRTEARQNLNDIHKFLSIQNPSEKFSEGKKSSVVHLQSMYSCTFLLPQWHQSLCVMVVSFLKSPWKRRAHCLCRNVLETCRAVWVLCGFQIGCRNPLVEKREDTVLLKRISKSL